MSHPCIKDFENNLNKDLEFFYETLARARTGRANVSLISHLSVESYGAAMPLEQVAKVSVEGNSALLVTPWDPQSLDGIESGIRNSDLGLNPSRSGASLRIQIPPLTSERRKEMVKILNADAESCRVAVRNHRRDVLHKIGALSKEGDISQDDEKVLEKKVQEIMTRTSEKIDTALKEKTKEISHI